MSALFCPNCGKSVPEGVKFCENCGYDLKSQKQSTSSPQQQPPQYQQQPPQYQQQPPQYQQQGQYPPPQQGGFMNRFQKPPDYIRPENYIETTTISQRVIGTMKMDVHVVEEIEARPELQGEAQKLLVISLALITIFQIISIFSLPDTYEIHSETGTIVLSILSNFVGGYVLIYLIASIGKFIGGSETTTSTSEMLRMLSYAYVIMASSDVITGIAIVMDSYALELIGSLLFLYSLIVFIFVIRRGLDKGYVTAIITLVISIILWLLFLGLAGSAVIEMFDGEPFEVIPPS